MKQYCFTFCNYFVLYNLHCVHQSFLVIFIKLVWNEFFLQKISSFRFSFGNRDAIALIDFSWHLMHNSDVKFHRGSALLLLNHRTKISLKKLLYYNRFYTFSK